MPAARPAQHRPELSPLALVPRPATVAATIALAALLVLGVVTDPVLLAVALAFTTLVLAWGWPRLLGSSSRFGSSFAIGATGVLVAAATAVTDDQPYLRLVPAALAIGLGLMFGHQIVRRDGRPRLTESVGVTSFGLALVAVGSAWMPLSRSGRATDLARGGPRRPGRVLARRPRRRVREGPPVDAAARDGARRCRRRSSPRPSPAAPARPRAALVGLLVAGVAHALRRALAVLPGIGSLPAQLAAGAAGLLVPGRRRLRAVAGARRLTPPGSVPP